MSVDFSHQYPHLTPVLICLVWTNSRNLFQLMWKEWDALFSCNYTLCLWLFGVVCDPNKHFWKLQMYLILTFSQCIVQFSVDFFPLFLASTKQSPITRCPILSSRSWAVCSNFDDPDWGGDTSHPLSHAFMPSHPSHHPQMNCHAISPPFQHCEWTRKVTVRAPSAMPLNPVKD